MANAVDRAVRAQGGGVVTPNQVKAMVVAARRAYVEQSKVGLVDDGVDFDAWRRAALHDIVGPAAPDSFRAVTQRDYAAVVAYFRQLAGEPAPAPRRAASDDARARALWALSLAEAETAGAFGSVEEARRYADALLRKIHGTGRDAASARQLWATIFTLKSRASSRRAKTAPGARGASGVHLTPPEGSERFPAFSRGL